MDNLYVRAKMAWGASMPKQIKRLHYRDDNHVEQALWDIMYDICSTTWTTDAKIAWSLLQGRAV